MNWISEQDPAKVESNKAKLREANWTTGSRNWLEVAGGNEDYALWLALCDRRCSRMIGLGIFDLEDWRWGDAFEGDYSPRDAVMECLSEDSIYSEMFAGID
jgi:hypothetical protein